jgi:hypothetical protein
MRNLKSAILFIAATMGGVSSAFGAAGEITLAILPVSDAVTYSVAATTKTLALNTYVASTLSFGNFSQNAINNVKVTVTASVNNVGEDVSLDDSIVYPAGCSKTSSTVFTCSYMHLKSLDSVSPFVILYKAPIKVVGNGVVTMDVVALYSEGINDSTSSPTNSIRSVSAQVNLGTVNPIQVKSAKPMSADHSIIFSGIDGVPSDQDNFRLAEYVNIPKLSAPASTRIDVLGVSATENSSAGNDCSGGGRFYSCPVFTTSILDLSTPTLTAPPVLLFTAADPLSITYRIDSSNLKMSPSKILNSVQIYYQAVNSTTWTPVTARCPTSTTAIAGGVPCIVGGSGQCYKNGGNANSELNGDCEWILNNDENGSTKIF